MPLFPLLLLAPPALTQPEPCVSCVRGEGTIVTTRSEIAGVPLEEPLSVELSTADGRKRLWSASQTAVSGPTHARLSKEDALDAVAALGGAQTELASAQLVWARTPVGLRLSWIVDPPPDLVALHNDVYRVDATTGSVHRVADKLSPASARAYPENPVKTPELETFELTGLLEPGDTLTHARFDVQTCVEPLGPGRCEVARLAAPDEAGDFLGYEPQSGFVIDDAFAETSAYVHSERFWEWMASLGITTTVCEDVFDERMVVATNYFLDGPEPVNNAYYTGFCPLSVIFGQAAENDYAYDGDAVYHELGHAVVHERVPTYIGRARARAEAWTYDSRAINEAVADAMSTALTGDPIVSESLSNRNIDTEASCPADLTGQQHNDSLPVSGALWRLQQAWGDDFMPVLLDALTALPQDVGYEEFADAVATVAGATIGAEAEATARAEFEARGLFDCERALIVEPGDAHTIFLDTELGVSPYTPAPLQFAIDVPAGTAHIEIDYFSADAVFGMATPADVAWRWGEPVLFEYGGEDGNSITTTFDDGAVDLPPAGTLEFEPSVSDEPSRLYLAFVNPDVRSHWVGVDSLTFIEAPSEGDTGGGESSTGEAGESGSEGGGTGGSGDVPGGSESSGGTESAPASVVGEDGCSCRSNRRRSGGGAALLLLLAFLRRRRFSRR